jgi:DNA-binding transcriptional MerR regulator
MTDQHDAPTIDFPQLLRQREVAELFRCSSRTVRHWTRKGWLKPVHVGRSTFYHLADVQKLSATGTD